MKKHLLVLIVAFFLSNAIYAQSGNSDLKVSAQLMRSTVRITTVDSGGNQHVATGFFLDFQSRQSDSQIPVVTTCRHVIRDTKKGTFFFQSRPSSDSNASPKSLTVTIEDFGSKWIPHPDGNIDLAVFPLAPLLQILDARDQQIRRKAITPSLFFSEDEDNAGALQEIVFVGYPIGLWDPTHNLPIARGGFTATNPSIDYDGNPRFLIDAACYPGSSGSPVFIFNKGAYSTEKGVTLGTRLKFLGVLFATKTYEAESGFVINNIPSALGVRTETQVPAGLGVVTKAQNLLAFREVFQQIKEKQQELKKKDTP